MQPSLKNPIGITMTVQNLLKGKGTFVPVIPADVRLQDVIDQLELDKTGALVVTNEDRGIIGIITERDIARGLKTFGRNVVEKPLRDMMTRDVFTCDVSQPLTAVLELMDKHQIQYVPITENGKLCGIINMLDLVKFRLDEIENEAKALKAYVAGSG